MGAPATGTSKTIEYAHKFYGLLVELANVEKWPTEVEGVEADKLVFRGKVTEVWNSLNVSQTYYGKVRRIFIENGCITQVERGQRNIDSVWVLHHPVPAEVELPEKSLTGRPSYDSLDRRLEALEAIQENLGGLDIADALRNMEIRLLHLEQKREIGEKNGKST